MFCIINGDFSVQLKSTNHNARQIYEVGAAGERMRASNRNSQFVSTNQLTRWKSNQPITFKANFCSWWYANHNNWLCFELWLVENVARLNAATQNQTEWKHPKQTRKHHLGLFKLLFEFCSLFVGLCQRSVQFFVLLCRETMLQCRKNYIAQHAFR